MDFAGGLAPTGDAMGTKSDGAVERASAVEILARLRQPDATKIKVNNSPRTGSATIACDVLVIGGGAAGVAAATAAGHAGARTVLLERYGFFGGLATTAQVGTICGLYLRDTTSAE